MIDHPPDLHFVLPVKWQFVGGIIEKGELPLIKPQRVTVRNVPKDVDPRRVRAMVLALDGLWGVQDVEEYGRLARFFENMGEIGAAIVGRHYHR